MRRLIPALLAATLALPASEPQRIVSTAPSITEILYALGLGPRVVGVTQYCRYPVEARTKPKIGSFLEPDFERILSLKPDLVLVIKNPVQVAEKLRALRVRAEDVSHDSVADTLASIGQIGRLTGKQKEAAALERSLRAEIEAVKQAAAKAPRRRVLFLVGRSPGTLQGMVGTGPGTFIDELLTLAGGQNVLANSPIPYPKVSLEQVLTHDPDVILDMGDFAHAEGRPMEPEQKMLALWQAYPRLRAVRNRCVRQVEEDVLVRPGPSLGKAARLLRQLLTTPSTASGGAR